MKIICTEKEKRRLIDSCVCVETLTTKALELCRDESDCKECFEKHIEFEIIEEETKNESN